jgi:protein phosphatase
VVVDVQTHQLEVNDIFLLCSDGLNSMLSDDEILQTVVDHVDDLDEAGGDLIRNANERGGEDNITVILAQVAEE